MLSSHNHTIDDSDNLETNKDKETIQFFYSDSKNEKDSDLDNDLNELVKLANNKVRLLLTRNLIFFLNSTIPCIVFIIIRNTMIELQGLIKIF